MTGLTQRLTVAGIKLSAAVSYRSDVIHLDRHSTTGLTPRPSLEHRTP